MSISKQLINGFIKSELELFRKQFDESLVPEIQETRSLAIAWLCYFFKNSVSSDNSSAIIQFVDYVDSKGNKLDISNLRQGQQVTARVTVRNSGHYGYLSNIALTAVFPAGFELANLRLGKIIDPKKANANYSDYRDDRVMHYFDLASGDSRTFNIPMIAAYAGNFQAPMMLCEVMYRPSINAKLRSGKCRITMQ